MQQANCIHIILYAIHKFCYHRVTVLILILGANFIIDSTQRHLWIIRHKDFCSFNFENYLHGGHMYK